jgi:short-subunit dehydrogenase
MKLDGCNALITGSSAGIGREFARQLAGRAKSLILIARREQRLNELRDELNQQYPNVAVSVRKTDLADLAHLNELLAWLDREKIDVDLLINNAGLGDSGAFSTSDPVRNEQMMLVNIVALTTLTRHLLPQMVARRRGGILNVSSSAGFLPIPDFAVYAATKAYVTSFSEALRAELRRTGVSVCALCPGPVHTEFQEVTRRPRAQPDTGPEFVFVPVEEVVRDALTALEANRPLVIPGFPMKLMMFLLRITPLPILRLLSRFSLRRG